MTGFWKHYKGGLYKILNYATDSESLEQVVVYQNVHNPEHIWARPARMWSEPVEVNGKLIPRFQQLTEDNCDHEMEGTYEPECKWCGYCITK